MSYIACLRVSSFDRHGVPEDSRQHGAHVLSILELDVYLPIGALCLNSHAFPAQIGLHLDHITHLHFWSWK